jgi:hypothetical protein
MTAVVTVVVERYSPRGYDVEDVLAHEVAGRSCMDLYGVEPRLHLLARDRTRLVCLFQAPDAEAMRAVLRTDPGPPPTQAFAVEVFPGTGDRLDDGLIALADGARALAVVERGFAEPVPFAEVQAVEERGLWCLAVHDVEHVRSYFAFGRRRMLCLYTAPDVEAVRLAHDRIGLPFNRIWGAAAIAPAGPTMATSSKVAESG